MPGVILALGVAVSGQMIALIVRGLHHIPVPVMLFVRLTLPALFVIPYAIQNARGLYTLNWRQYWLRGLIRYSSICCTYHGYQGLPMQIAATIGFTEPFFVTACSCMAGYETLSVRRLGWMMAGYLSVCILGVGAPSLGDFSQSAVWFMLFANMLSAIAIVIGKYMTIQDGPAFSATYITLVMPWFALVGMLGTNSYSAIGELGKVHTFPLIMLGLLGVLHTGLFHYAIKEVDPSMLSMLQYLKLPSAIFLDCVIFGIYPSLYSIPLLFAICLSSIMVAIDRSAAQ